MSDRNSDGPGRAPIPAPPGPEVDAVAWPFFDAGPGSPSDAMPLGLISGGLLVDSGEADRTFVFRAQDRFLGFNTLFGLRTILLVASDAHARLYRQAIARLRDSWRTIARSTGVLPEDGPPEPLFVGCDIDRLRLHACWEMVDQIRAGLLPRGPGPRLFLNQVSPTYAAFVDQFDRLVTGLGIDGGYGLPGGAALGDLALQLHDKAYYTGFVRDHASDGFPPHVETVAVAPEAFLAVRDWRDLVALYRDGRGGPEPSELFVKSSRDSGGNVSSRLTRATLAARLPALRTEIARELLGTCFDAPERVRALREEIDTSPVLATLGVTDDRLLRFRRQQAASRSGIRVLIQPVVSASGQEPGPGAGIGLSLHVSPDGAVAPIAAGVQLYRDPECTRYLGSSLSPETSAELLAPERLRAATALVRRLAERGWRGPINFDARRGAEGEYVWIGDCNPRLSGIYPALAAARWLRVRGLPARELICLGYRGDFAREDLPAWLAAMDRRGVLYTEDRPRGALVVPNLARRDGFDVVLVNVPLGEAPDSLAGIGAETPCYSC